MPTHEQIDRFLAQTEPLPKEEWDAWRARLLRMALPEWWPDEREQLLSAGRAYLVLKAEAEPGEAAHQNLLAEWDETSELPGERIFDLLRNAFYRLTVERTRRPGWVVRTVTRPLPDRNRLGSPMFQITGEDQMPKEDGRFPTLQEFVEALPNWEGITIGGVFFPNPNYDPSKDPSKNKGKS